jgi:hypothetical protein
MRAIQKVTSGEVLKKQVNIYTEYVSVPLDGSDDLQSALIISLEHQSFIEVDASMQVKRANVLFQAFKYIFYILFI